MRLAPEVLFEFIPQFLRDGWQVNVHANGDRANGIVLDAFEVVLKGVNVTALHPCLAADDEGGYAKAWRLGVIARRTVLYLEDESDCAVGSSNCAELRQFEKDCVQTARSISDMWYAQDRLGPERVKGLYAFRSIIASGAKITLGPR
ncbi:hypothetical protein B0H13DRAFT_1853618 [Mycena leptocephala]|nr:hypothetical protein B0H13DRAFT_1853618 [Mycena leptocephala]